MKGVNISMDFSRGTHIILFASLQAKYNGNISWPPGNHHHCAGGHVEHGEAGAHHVGGGLLHLLRHTFFCA